MRIEMKIIDQRLGNEFPLPTFIKPGDAGIDVRACIPGKISLYPGQVVLISTGFSIFIEDPNYCAVLLPRSGRGHKEGLVLGNLVGLIDSGYQGPVKVSCWNRHTHNWINMHPGDRIAQLVILPIARPTFDIVNEFSVNTDRGTGGIGHTGNS